MFNFFGNFGASNRTPEVKKPRVKLDYEQFVPGDYYFMNPDWKTAWEPFEWYYSVYRWSRTGWQFDSRYKTEEEAMTRVRTLDAYPKYFGVR